MPMRRNSKLPKGYTKYGADMGRASSKLEGPVTLERVALDEGGYDNGGAYWGGGQPLWRAEDEDGNEKFFRAATRVQAENELEGHEIRVVDDDTSKLEHDGTLKELLEGQAESMDHEDPQMVEVTDELRAAAVAYERDLKKTLAALVKKYPPANGATAVDLFEEGDAPYNVYQTLVGSGVGIYDGRWVNFYDDEIDSVQEFIEAKMGSWADETGSGKLGYAFINAIDASSPEREENRSRRKNPQNAWAVFLNDEFIDSVYFDADMDADDVKRSLVRHDGFDERIKVKPRERRRTHAPDMLATNPRGRDFRPGVKVKLTGKFLKSTGQARSAEARSTWKVVPCTCSLCKGGDFVATNEPRGKEELSMWTADELKREPGLKHRHFAKDNLSIVGQADSRGV